MDRRFSYQSEPDHTEFPMSPGSPYSSPGQSFRSPYTSFSPIASSMTLSPSSSLSACSSPHAQTFNMFPRSSMSRVIPKIEQSEDDQTQIKAPPLPSESPCLPTVVKRGRGRPRKHPIPTLDECKITKGRSKTGCLTCRRRKKKCDETKPECNNCVKNSVVCEGYPDRVHWQSGKQKAEANSNSQWSSSLSPSLSFDLPCLIDGVETPRDKMLLDHFVHNVSRVLTLVDDESNPFQDLIVPEAMHHRGLMHSILSLSGAHLAVKEGNQQYEVDQKHHFAQAIQYLTKGSSCEDQNPVVAQIILFCLISICLGDKSGVYRLHMDVAGKHVSQCNTETPIGRFLYEFIMYHDVASSITTLDRRPLRYMADLRLPGFILQPAAGTLIGVLDGLFHNISRITMLRDAVRERRRRQIHPHVNYEILSAAVAIDTDIRAWEPPHRRDDQHRYIAAQLYRQCTWIYLYRTTQPSQSAFKMRKAVEEGLTFIRRLPHDSSTQSILLMPLFILGCAAFERRQRPEISESFETLFAYSGLRNVVVAHEAVQEVWRLMDLDEENSWDWETIILSKGYDILVA